jgi:outer membrane protein OmpA-like peptidoglycan-associated protein
MLVLSGVQAVLSEAVAAVEAGRQVAVADLPDGMVNIAGRWDSTYGPVDLKITSVSSGIAKFIGSWNQGGQIGTITSGTFDGKQLQMEYYMPWKKTYGTWKLTLDSTGWQADGTYQQPNDSGAWNIARPVAFVSPSSVNLDGTSHPKLPEGMIDISGPWESDYGPVNLRIVRVVDGKAYLVGSWKQGKNTGTIVDGVFDGASIVMNYYVPWSICYGKWVLNIDPNHKQFLGKYQQRNDTGSWNMVRPPNYIAISAPELSEEPSSLTEPLIEDQERLTRVTFNSDVLFDVDKFVLRPDAISILQKVKEGPIARFPRRHISVQGHTDDTGETMHNLELSGQRALSVAKWLQTAGVDAQLMDVTGYGKSKPKFPNDSDANRARNRRVELVLTEE